MALQLLYRTGSATRKLSAPGDSPLFETAISKEDWSVTPETARTPKEEMEPFQEPKPSWRVISYTFG